MSGIFCLLSIPAFKFLDGTPQGTPHRFGSIDGLRGVLALSVVMHHLAVNYNFQQTGIWQIPPSGFYTLLGQVGVSLFFMITGFLFTGKLLSPRPVSWVDLYVGRIFRIGPLYLAAVFIMVAIVAFETNFSRNESVLKIAQEVGVWLGIGISSSKPTINGYSETNRILAGVTWTIHYEWMFYFSLIFLNVFKKHVKILSGIIFFIALIVLQVTHSEKIAYGTLFLAGITARSWSFTKNMTGMERNILSALALFSLSVIFFSYDHGYAAGPVAFSFVTFYCICNGANIFGVLDFPGVKRAGDISYGIYILQGIPIFILFLRPTVKEWAMSAISHYWAVSALCLLMLLALAMLGYLLIEKPFISYGRMVAAWLKSVIKLPSNASSG